MKLASPYSIKIQDLFGAKFTIVPPHRLFEFRIKKSGHNYVGTMEFLCVYLISKILYCVNCIKALYYLYKNTMNSNFRSDNKVTHQQRYHHSIPQ